MFKFNKSSGQASRLLLVLAVVVLVAVIITYLILKMAEKPQKPVAPGPTEPVAVYEQILGDIKFIFESARDMGQTLRGSDAVSTQYSNSNPKDLQISNTGAKFIRVTIGAQNKGKENTSQGDWEIENIVDSEGREFVQLDYGATPWLPHPNLCGVLLKPAFDPVPCVKIYEVSRESTGLRVRVSSNKLSSLINLIVK